MDSRRASARGPRGERGRAQILGQWQTIPWRRDLLDAFTFHLDVPAGVESLDVEFDYIEPSGRFQRRRFATDKLVIVSLEPRRALSRGNSGGEDHLQAHAAPALGLEIRDSFASAERGGRRGDLQAGLTESAWWILPSSPASTSARWMLRPPDEPIHHEIDVVADSAAALEMTPEMQKGFTNMVAETGKLFGARHYRDYHFLLTLSDHVAHFGLEHHECNDSRTGERSLLTPEGRREVAGLLGHEFVHSWNGKFRRPADLSTPLYESPMKTDLLWVYEGLTSYLGPLLAARSGLWTPEQYREDLATTAADMGPGRPGRTWRPLQDTADAISGEPYGRGGWTNWQRSVDYYPEGDLIWLEVATLIHDQTHGQKSFEDFARAFYGGPNHGPELKPYTFDELVHALQAVAPYDWAGYFHDRLTSTSPEAPVGGIEAGGWKVDYTDKPPEAQGGGRFAGGVNALYSLGLRLGTDGNVQDSLFGGPAYLAGITRACGWWPSTIAPTRRTCSTTH